MTAAAPALRRARNDCRPRARPARCPDRTEQDTQKQAISRASGPTNNKEFLEVKPRRVPPL
jgi:hypothetical protein